MENCRKCIFEVGKGVYSRTYRFLDINYVTAGAEEQMRILKQYCKTVNAIDVYFLITIFNRNKNMQVSGSMYFSRKKEMVLTGCVEVITRLLKSAL